MKHGIIIPCYNEANTLASKHFINLIKSSEKYGFCFVNDGSTDNTLEALNFIRRSANSPNVYIYDLPENVGKSEAIRQGTKFLETHTSLNTIGFLHADLSTGLHE